MKKTIGFTYDPLNLTRLLFQMYVEKHIEETRHQVVVFTYYEYLDKLTDEELKEVLTTYVRKENLAEITYSDYEKDFKVICEIVEGTKAFNDILQAKRLSGVRQYEFHPDMGVSGVLLADGEFMKCGHQQHHILVESIEWEEQNKAIYFSSSLGHNDRGVISFSPLNRERTVTQDQLRWVDEHLTYFDGGQKEMAEIYFRREEE